MKIRAKIVLVVLPLIITTLLLAGISSYASAANGITRIAREFLDFKASELRKYADGQWRLLVDNGFSTRPEYVEATKQAVEAYARSVSRSATEVTAAFDAEGRVVMKTRDLVLSPDETAAVRKLAGERRSDLLTDFRADGRERVAKGFYFDPFGWYILITEERDTYYSDVNRITYQTGIILGASSVLAVLLLVVFARYLTSPLTRVVTTMRDIITYNDLSERVQVEYRDETGELAHTFNIMVGELEKAYNKIKGFAFDAVVARKREQKIRSMFQSYVPQHVIDSVIRNPEQALVGDNRVLALLFSDIRSFTTISETMRPDELVEWLNRYFEPMVDAIMKRNGIVDKYIGDAIMAFWGTPVKRDDDALQSVLAAVDMISGLESFNARLREAGKKEWHIGVGINYGIVTVGNMGTERKMNYTVIGDMVNLASRLEGLTKKYHEPVLISESVHMKVKDKVPCRLVDNVEVKGKTEGVKIFAAKAALTEAERQGWSLHERGMDAYFKRAFDRAEAHFREVQRALPGDYPSQLMAERCATYREFPPPADWDGVEIMTEK
jgi:adenylate cyclase